MNTRDIEKYTKDYLCDDFENVMVHFRKKKVLESLNKYFPSNVLEIGCGLTSMFEEYRKFDNFAIIEPSVVFCEQVKNSDYYNKRVEIINDFFENRNEYLASKKFDFIIVSSLLHEITEPDRFLDKLRSVCVENTIVHINVPNSMSFHFLLAKESGIIKELGVMSKLRKKMQTTTVFDMEKLMNIVKSHGFTIIDQGSYFFKLFNYEKMKKAVDCQILDKNILGGLYSVGKYFPEHNAEIFVNCGLDL